MGKARNTLTTLQQKMLDKVLTPKLRLPGRGKSGQAPTVLGTITVEPYETAVAGIVTRNEENDPPPVKRPFTFRQLLEKANGVH